MSESDGPTREASTINLAHEQYPAFQSFTQRINSALGSFRDRKNKQDHASVLSGLSGLRAGSKGQLEVDKSIWDLTKGVKVQEQQVSTAQSAWQAICTDTKTVMTTVRRDPKVAFIPLLLLLLLLGGGLWAVYASAAQETEHRRQVAQQVVRDKALYLETELAKAFMPAYVCSVYVRRDPSWPAVNGSFPPMALEMIRLSKAGSVLTLSLIPNGVIYTMVPLNGSSPADDLNWRAIGKDWLQDKYNQDKVLQAISTRNLTIIGPYNLTQGGIGMVAMLSINITPAPANATFDIPPYVHGTLGAWQTPPRVQLGPNLTDTPYAPYMYDNATSTKWWGLTTVLISWDVLRENVTQLEDLELQGYEYVLARPVLRKELLQARPDLANGSHELAVAWSSGVQAVPLNATNNRLPPRKPGAARPLVYYDLHERLLSPVSALIRVEGAQLTLYAHLAAGWCPAWRSPMAAVTVVLAVLLSLLLFLVLVNRRQHMRLLHAMIPKKVISTLRRGKVFTESFEVVTVLFSDIVSYTTMSAQMAPIEVVQMLDELYVEFDNLAEKHKLYKLDTIGDAFMLVGGAPESDVEGAAAAAARVAQMALDMILLTSTKVLAGGHVVKIRVGVHSGPAVAAVVGRKAPKYTLFGDTVNTASRMESNGSPMRIHVSAATAELLGQAGGFTLEPRGEIPVKGKGVMSTYWVTGTQAWQSGPCPRAEAADISGLHPLPLAPGVATIAENKEADRCLNPPPAHHAGGSSQRPVVAAALACVTTGADNNNTSSAPAGGGGGGGGAGGVVMSPGCKPGRRLSALSNSTSGSNSRPAAATAVPMPTAASWVGPPPPPQQQQQQDRHETSGAGGAGGGSSSSGSNALVRGVGGAEVVTGGVGGAVEGSARGGGVRRVAAVGGAAAAVPAGAAAAGAAGGQGGVLASGSGPSG
ncbi:hypothetical protein Agub_g5722 [Astrephomene gubernaculifera]|uniref:Guanylate cyclase domain-containing protein n=1 Tax=Astrephomene gubernaculifera TaxID=47775 RepID=A0AAD3DR94_9CHLO|nr:hypothetical protein Agub_g5722 [Astrephomene gubernaculifera]